MSAMARNRPVDPASHEDRPSRTNLSRRRFLTGIGAGTAGAAVTLGPGAISGVLTPADAATPADRFGRIFPGLPPFAPATRRCGPR